MRYRISNFKRLLVLGLSVFNVLSLTGNALCPVMALDETEETYTEGKEYPDMSNLENNDDSSEISNADDETEIQEPEEETETEESETNEEFADEAVEAGEAEETEDSHEPEIQADADEEVAASAEETENAEVEMEVFEMTEEAIEENVTVSLKSAPAPAKHGDFIYFLNCSMSDTNSNAFLIESNGHYMLIDSSNPTSSDYSDAWDAGHGNIDSGKYVAGFLKSIGVTHLDYVVGTHSHWDHIGGMKDIANSGLVDSDTVYICKNYVWVEREENKSWHNLDYYNVAIKNMANKGAKIIKLDELNEDNASSYGFAWHYGNDKRGDKISFSMGNFNLDFYNLHFVDSRSENLNSIVIYANNGIHNALLMADLESALGTEKAIIDEVVKDHGKIDIYQVGHHGCGTSTTIDTVLKTSPKFAIYSSGTKRNDSNGAYRIFKHVGAKVYFTGAVKRAISVNMRDSGLVMKTFASDSEKTASKNLSETVTQNLKSTGWTRNTASLKWTYVKDGVLQTGWIKDNNRWYYIESNFQMVTGLKKIGNKQYFFALETASPVSEGQMLTGWQKASGKWHYFDSEGAGVTGWKKLSWNNRTSWYYFDGNGVMLTGWQTLKDSKGTHKFYLGGDGAMRTGTQTIDGKQYKFDGNGYLQSNGGATGGDSAGWQKISGKWYFFVPNGNKAKGWQKLAWNSKTSWYYFNSNGAMLTGWQTLKDSKGTHKFYLGGDGAMRTGTQTIDGKQYKFDNNGYLQNETASSSSVKTGWQKISGKWHYVKSDGKSMTGWQKLKWSKGINWFYFNSKGEMLTGWQKLSWNNKTSWYYFDGNGAMLTGWQKLKDSKGTHQFYLGSDGAMRTGTQKINGRYYKFDNNGYML